MENTIALHATVEKAGVSRKARGGKSYKVTFSYPRAFLKYIDEFMEAKVDAFWNEEKVLSSATIKDAKQKPRKNQDPLYTFTLDCDGADTIHNLGDKVDEAGDLRLAVTQLALNIP